MRYALDTNILVYAVDPTAGDRYAAAQGIVERAAAAGAVLSEQSLHEFSNVALRKLGARIEEVNRLCAIWARRFEIASADSATIAQTLEIVRRRKIGVFDARQIAVCRAAGCRMLLSEDLQDGAVFDRLRVVNPFAPANARRLKDVLAP